MKQNYNEYFADYMPSKHAKKSTLTSLDLSKVEAENKLSLNKRDSELITRTKDIFNSSSKYKYNRSNTGIATKPTANAYSSRLVEKLSDKSYNLNYTEQYKRNSFKYANKTIKENDYSFTRKSSTNDYSDYYLKRDKLELKPARSFNKFNY